MSTTSLTVSPLASHADRPEVRRRIEEVQAWLDHLAQRNPEDASILVTDRVRGNIAEVRSRFLELAPMFKRVRDEGWYRYHPEGFTSFEEWLAQPEIDISLSRATDMVNFWETVVPAAVEAGLDVDEMAREIGESKLRLLVPIVRQAKRQQEQLVAAGMSREQAEAEAPIDIVELTESAKTLSWRDLRELLRPSQHDPEPEILFISEPAGDGYWHVRTKEPVDDETIELIDRKLRPRWYDSRGRFRAIGDKRQKGLP